MSEWFTFGQLLDKMQVGDIAESEETHQIHYYIKRGTDGFFYEWMGKHVEDVNYFDRAKLQECHLRCKWRILPRYVSFEKAKEVFRQGKTICCHLEKEVCRYSPDSVDIYSQADAPSWYEILEGKWTIEE
jgi:hypothetical protein